MSFIRNHIAEVAAKLRDVLYVEVETRSRQVGGPALHYIHSVALFDCLVLINTFFIAEAYSEEAADEYIEHAESLVSKFLDIMESLKDFRPGKQSQSET